jgi:predicted transcriptional regulator
MSISSKQDKSVGGYSLVRLNLHAALKKRVAAVARHTGRTPHAFMVEAIELETRLGEQRKQSRALSLKASIADRRRRKRSRG